MGLDAKYVDDDTFVEVIYPVFEGKIHRLDLRTGEPTKPPIEVGWGFKGTASVDPRGYPLLYAGQGRHGRAEAAQRAAIASASRHAHFHHHLALALDAQGRFEEGLAAHAEARSLNPHNPELARCLIEAERRSGADRQGRWGEVGFFAQ